MLRVLAAIAVLASCGDAIELSITSDRPATALDAICVGVADRSPHGGQFGRAYQLPLVGGLPQTLRVEPGGATAALAWVRGDRGGVPVARASAAVEFDRDVTLAMPACVRGGSNEPAQVGDAVGPPAARLVASQGQGGSVVVAIGSDGATAVIAAAGGALVTRDGPMLAGGAVDAVAVDVDGDCDDDVVVALAGAPPELLRRDGDSFVDAGPVGGAVASAVAAGDLDGDGDLDLVVGDAATLTVLANDGGGGFTPVAGAIDAASRVSAVSALALGDVDGDGTPDLVVGQAGSGTLEAWSGQTGGSFLAADGVVPPVPLDVARLTLADADGDFDPDLEVAVRGAPWRLYVDRDGSLEDQSFVRLPQPAATANAIAIGGWDGGCEPDAVVASDAGGPALHGQADGTLGSDGAIPPATDVVMVDLDGDGALDAVVATAQGVAWLAR
jgi:hypothetical protein|nr:VCBS repeat-containing protein [Kofleriaceae bacterium]